jgi:hypothetical protein
MNKIDEARNVLANSWCRGAFSTVTEAGMKYCSIGALDNVFANSRPNLNLNDEYWDAVGVIAEVIRENYSKDFALKYNAVDMDWTTWSNMDVVIAFNDDIAESHDAVMAVFEKAAVKWEENHAFN